MASDLNPVLPQLTSDVQDRMGHAHSKDSEQSNSMQREPSQNDHNRSSPTVLENSLESFETASETSANETANLIDPARMDSVSKSEKTVDIVDNFVKECTCQVGQSSTEIQTVSYVKNSKFPSLSKDANTVLPISPKEAESFKIIKPALSEENESTEIIQASLSEEFESTRPISLVLADDNESTSVIPPVLAEVNKSTEIIQKALSEENKSTPVTQPPFTQENESTQLIQPVLVEKNESTRVIKTVLLEEDESTQLIQPVLVEMNESTPVIQPAFTHENESTQLIQPVLVEKNESTQLIQPVLVEKSESTPVIKSVLVEENESNEIIYPSPAEENESTEVMHSSFPVHTEVIPTAVSKESVSTIVIQPIFSEKTMSSELNQTALSDETELTEVGQPVDSEEVNLSKEFPFEPSKKQMGKLRLKIPTNDMINPSALPEIEPQDPSIAFSLPLDFDNFLSLLDTEEYKDSQLYVVPGKGRVIVTPTTPSEPFFPKIEKPPSPEKISSELIKHLSTAKDSKVTDVCSEKSLKTLVDMIFHWIQRCMEKIFNNREDLIDYSKNELYYGLDLFKQMNKRIEILLRAAEGLPDPSAIGQCESGRLRNSIRVLLIDTGVKMRRRIKDLEGETIEHYNSISAFLLFPSAVGLNNEYPTKQQTTETKKMLVTFFLKLSEDFISLSDDVENFREHIRSFCSEIDRLL